MREPRIEQGRVQSILEKRQLLKSVNAKVAVRILQNLILRQHQGWGEPARSIAYQVESSIDMNRRGCF